MRQVWIVWDERNNQDAVYVNGKLAHSDSQIYLVELYSIVGTKPLVMDSLIVQLPKGDGFPEVLDECRKFQLKDNQW